MIRALIVLGLRETAKDVLVPIAVAAIAACAVVKAAAIANRSDLSGVTPADTAE